MLYTQPFYNNAKQHLLFFSLYSITRKGRYYQNIERLCHDSYSSLSY